MHVTDGPSVMDEYAPPCGVLTYLIITLHRVWASLMELIETIDHTTKQLLAQPLFAAYATLSDFLFFVCYGFVMSLFLDPTSLALSRVVAQEQATITELLNTGVLLPAIGWLLLTFVSIYLLFCILEGSAFYWTQKIVGRTVQYRTFLLRCFRAAIPWFVIFVGYELVAFIRDYAAQTQPLSSFVYTLFDIFIIVMWYGAGVHFALLHRATSSRAAITSAVHHFKKLWPAVAFLLILAFLLDFVLRAIPGTTALLVAARALLFLMWILWTRTFWFTTL